MDYLEFLERKKHISVDYGIEPNFIPESMFDFQKHITKYLIKKGRGAGFLDTGLGKTIIELTVAKNYHKSTGKPVLIICPLAVAFQFVSEAKKFGLDSVSYSKTGKLESDIIVCNYERLDKFNPENFDCVILDESSILKNFEGEIKNQITSFLKKVKYRFLFTATPSPNDYIELGTSSEALGYMGYIDMLSKYFKNNNNNTVKIGRIAQARQGVEWYLKSHAERAFWNWIGSWSISLKKPSDLGFSDDLHKLPELIETQTIVNNDSQIEIDGQIQLFNFPAQNFREIKAEVRGTILSRCEMAYQKALDHDTSVYWVNLNDEADLIRGLDKSSIEIRGQMDIDEKEDILVSFSKGEIKKLITKTSITAFGLNWQHCNHTTYFPTYSYEQYYQAIRRFWRFGQKRAVTVDIILSDGQTKVMDSLMVKKDKAIKMFEELSLSTNQKVDFSKAEFSKSLTLPTFIKENIK
jgi:hypothetical protein